MVARLGLTKRGPSGLTDYPASHHESDTFALGPMHGFGIALRIEQISEKVLQLNEGTVYTSLLRLQQQGWIGCEWGASENNRKAKFYSINGSGRKQLARETENWERI